MKSNILAGYVDANMKILRGVWMGIRQILRFVIAAVLKMMNSSNDVIQRYNPSPIVEGAIEFQYGWRLDFLCSIWGMFDYSPEYPDRYIPFSEHTVSTQVVLIGGAVLEGAEVLKPVCWLGKQVFHGASIASKLPVIKKVYSSTKRLLVANKTKVLSPVTQTIRHGSSQSISQRISSITKTYFGNKSPITHTGMPPNHINFHSSPFQYKSAEELHHMFLNRGLIPQGPNPMNGIGSYFNNLSKRTYHIDPKNVGRYREPNHIDVTRPRDYNGSLTKKRFSYRPDE